MEKSKETKIYSARKWLNPKNHEDTGTIQASVTFYDNVWTGRDQKVHKRKDVCADITLGDCSRTVTLSFGFHNKKTAQERLKKIRTIIDALTDFEDALVEAAEMGEWDV